MANTTENISSYFEQRMNLLGVTPEQNKVKVWQNDRDNPGKSKLEELPVFRESDKGIDILVVTLDRYLINYKPDESRWSKNYCITRLEIPIIKKDGSTQKYYIPKGQGTYPFFHPILLDAYETKTSIDTLFLVEGYFKAWKGCMHGIPVIGLSSITHMKDKDSGGLHPDILKLMLTCKVKRMVWVTDGDCLDITGKEIKDGTDLYKRPKNFFASCETFKQLLDDYDVDKYFLHIDSDGITGSEKSITRDQVKGLDDLMVTFPDKIEDIKDDISSVSANGKWFVKHNITTGTRKIHQYFHLTNVNEFYLFHIERRADLKGKEFVFNGTRYKYDETANECKVVTPAEAKKYFRVGDTYYKFIEKINQFSQIEKAFEKRQKETIKDDHGKDFTKHIAKHEAFCNVPDHVNFQQVIYNCFNVYSPFEHEPEADVCNEDDCPFITAFFKHIFGTGEIKVKQKDGPPINTQYYQLGFDYVQLLYQQPTQRLPILCLVSKENETGKTTFGDLMKGIFTNNATVVGNSDLADDFNSFWATKLLIMCDETKIDKQAVVERVKSLTFAKKIGMNAKGKDKVEIDFFGKFTFFTNNEENFIYASEEDLRYWVIKVPKLKEKNPDFLQNMLDEIPFFLSFLNSRKIVAPRMTRMWFDPELLRTEALKKVMANSHSHVNKELSYYLKEMFLDFGVKEIMMSCRAIKENFFRGKEENYIERVLKEEMKMRPVQKFVYKNKKYNTEQEAVNAVISDSQSGITTELEALNHITRVGAVMRHSYPRWELRTDPITRKSERIAVLVQENGRPYRFKREDFVQESELSDVPADLLQMAEMNDSTPAANESAPSAKTNNEIPF